MSTQSHIIKQTTIASLFNEALNGENYLNKIAAIEQLENGFDLSKFDKQIEEYNYDASHLRKLTKKSFTLTDMSAKFAKKEITAEKIGKFLEATLPAKPTDKFINGLITAAKAEIEKESLVINELKAKKAEVVKNKESTQRQLIADTKVAYSEWKKTAKPEDDTPNEKFALLRTIDDAKHNSIRLSKSSVLVQYLTDILIKEYFTLACAARSTRNHKIAESFKDLSVPLPEQQPTLTVADFVEADYGKSQLETFLFTHYLRKMREAGGTYTDSVYFAKLTQNKGEILASGIADFIKKNNLDVDEAVTKLVPSLIYEFIFHLGSAASKALATHGTISTLKPEIFDNIFESSYIFRGEDYSTLGDKISELWKAPKKAE